ncbi:unnamed protein product [Brachionus calyciflorus]|uniref:Protein HGH1 homolog n=1 Tax=Brachionus calyciflorus TaxID=104777 RepID=A0A813R8S6_9BILA|nr:unnamed protein product [Brachionus calyciflorus]
MESLNELIDFISVDTRLDIKTLALHHILSLTGNFESRKLLLSNRKCLKSLIDLAFSKDEQKAINKDAFFSLINLSADEIDAGQMMLQSSDLVQKLLDYILDENSPFSDTSCAILSNISRGKRNSQIIFENYFVDSNNNGGKSKPTVSLAKLLQVFCTEKFNKTNNLDYLAPFICNLTQLESVRNTILNDSIILQRLLPYTTYSRSIIRRGGIIGAIKNCCFNYDYHEKLLLSPDIDLLSRLLLPLAGPEEFELDEMEKLPDDLQFLPPNKERDVDPDVRIMLLETIMMLCSRKECRSYIKDKNAYLILRELHKWEKDEKALNSCEKLVQILIADEPEDGHENLHQVAVPEELSQKFYEFEKQELEKNFE